jgi:hypothetical protein
MLPVIVSEVMPVGTVMLNEVDEVVFAIAALDGTTPGWSAESRTVTS